MHLLKCFNCEAPTYVHADLNPPSISCTVSVILPLYGTSTSLPSEERYSFKPPPFAVAVTPALPAPPPPPPERDGKAPVPTDAPPAFPCPAVAVPFAATVP